MTNLVAMIVLIVFFAPCSGATQAAGRGDWWMFHHDPQHTGRSQFAGPETPTKKWQFVTSSAVCSSPAIGSDGTIYVGSSDHDLYAIGPNGSEKWQFWTGQPIDSSPAIGADGTVYVGSDDYHLYAFSPDGSRKWQFEIGYYVTSPAIGSDGTIYVGCVADALYAINPDGSEKWRFASAGDSSPVLGTDGTVYAESYAISPDGSRKWTFPMGGYVDSSTAVGSDGTVYVGSRDDNLYAVNPDGSEKWHFRMGDHPGSTAIASNGTIYVLCGDKNLYAINPDGSRKWQFAMPYADGTGPTVDSNGTIYVASVDGNLYAINPDGSKKWQYAMGDWAYTPPVIGSDGVVYLGLHDGSLYAIGDGRETPAPPGLTIGAPSFSYASVFPGEIDYIIAYTNAPNITLSDADVTLNRTGTANGTVTVWGTGTDRRTVAISNFTGDGTLGISIAAGTASDAAGNLAPAAGPSGAFTVDAPPGVSISAPSPSVTTTGPVSFTVSYTQADSITLSPSDVELIRTGTADGRMDVTGSGTACRTITISDITGAGTLSIYVFDFTAFDAAGNPALSAGPSTPFYVDVAPPEVAITSPTPDRSCARYCPTLTLAGSASDDADVASVYWSSDHGDSQVCTGTRTWSASNITLAEGDNVITVTATDVAGRTASTAVTVTRVPRPPSVAWTGVEMVSLPIIPDQANPQQAISPNLSGWYAYDPTPPGRYRDISDHGSWFEPASATPGRGFWARFTGTPSVPCGMIPDQTREAVIALKAGWNLIGCPFIKPVSWDRSAIQVDVEGTRKSLKNSGAACLDYAWGWDSAAGSYFLVYDPAIIPTAHGQLEPWQAYWVKALVQCNLILPPP